MALIFDPTTKTFKYFNGDGVRQSGMIKVGNQRYTFDPVTGNLKFDQAGELQINGHWYYANPNGTLVTGFKKIAGNRTVYYNPANAKMTHGEAHIGDHWYFFALNNGNMVKGFITLPDGRHVYYDNQGQMYHGEFNRNGHWYFYHLNNGAMATGFTQLPDNRTAYYDGQG